MARKMHLAVMTDGQLEQHRSWLLMEHAACLAEKALRADLIVHGVDAQVRLFHMNRDGGWEAVDAEGVDERLFTPTEYELT